MEIPSASFVAMPLPSAEASLSVSQQRLSAFVESLPEDLLAEEDALPVALAKLNAAPRTKLQKVYRLLGRVGAKTAGFVACGKGCSDCCKMNVTISDIEAKQIAALTERRTTELKESVTHDHNEFLGLACPFLDDDICSIYEHRPFACRKHFNFDVTAYWCHPSRSLTVEIRLLGLSGVDTAYQQIIQSRGNPILADIRDFFPGD
jgi:Fe-S-cluster containining protein